MTISEWDIERDGFRILPRAVDANVVERLLSVFDDAFSGDSQSVRARSSRGHVYAARNLIESIPEVTTVWQSDPMLGLLREVLGDDLGLVRALFFDKPPERTWNLPWHKDTSISVKDNSTMSPSFSRPTIKAGVPHVIASDALLRQMLTLRIHLDEVTDENGPLRVIPRSHVASDSEGDGVDCSVTIHASPGDVLVMRPMISHASGASVEGTLRHRRILHLEFASNERLPDGYQWHDFIRPTLANLGQVV
ncbi:MAG: phytanoyl-CoA dioxygenase family protein [Planctomycetales bacterium]|nr:phytanoyl-CoA dioxygenase family protein [Planctomycetales bacterium]